MSVVTQVGYAAALQSLVSAGARPPGASWGTGGSQTLRWRKESRANPSLPHVQVGGQAIDQGGREGAEENRGSTPCNGFSPMKITSEWRKASTPSARKSASQAY